MSKSCKDSSTLSENVKNKLVKTIIDDKIKTNIIVKEINIPKTGDGESKIG